MSIRQSYQRPSGQASARPRPRLTAARLLAMTGVLLFATGVAVTAPPGAAAPVRPSGSGKSRPARVKPHPVAGPKVHVKAAVRGRAVTLNATSTAPAGAAWWACFGDLACSAAKPSARGVVAAGGAITPLQHTYRKVGRYPASVTVVQGAISRTAAVVVTLSATGPTAVLAANHSAGSGALPVKFDGSASVVGTGGSWAFCFGDRSGCSQSRPDASGQITKSAPAVALPNSPTHTYRPGKYTATMWVSSGATTSRATAAIAVSPPVAAPDATCSASGAVRTCDLYAEGDGVAHANGATIPFWGFTLGSATTPRLGGPVLIATEGETLAFRVHNDLTAAAGNVSITVPSLSGAPDTTGVAPGHIGDSGSFTLTRPGTYVYEAGMTDEGERQVAMGLSGVLIVRPSIATAANENNCAYDAAVSGTDCVANHDALNYFAREKVVVVNELDADYSADPFHSDTGDYHPTDFFVDGSAYDPSKPALDPSNPAFDPASDNVALDAAPGEAVLLRYADLGLREHALNLTGLVQSETGRDGFPLPYPSVQNTEFLNAGQTGDAFVTIPPLAVTGDQYPIYDAGFHLNNGAAAGLGGMYASVNVVNGSTANDVGPVANSATADPTFDPSTPNVDNGQVPTLAVHAGFDAQATAGGSTPNVDSVRWALDAVPGPSDLWQNSNASPQPAGATTASFDFSIGTTELMSVLGTEPDRIFGDHVLWLQAKDSNNKWGPAVGASFSLAMRDPVISTLAIDPTVTNGTTGSAQTTTATTTVAGGSDGAVLPQSLLNVASTAGFPASCPADSECRITVATTVATGPAQGSTVNQMFTYTGTSGTSFTGLATAAPIPGGTYQFTAGAAVLFDGVPPGFVAVTATATASLPGWVINGAQACVAPATGTAPDPNSGVETACKSSTNVVDLTTNAVGALVGVQGFVPPPTTPLDPASFWIVVRAQEGPDGISCTVTPDACRWSPWLYYHPVTAGTTQPLVADPNTYRTLTVVKTGPSVSGLTVSPSPNNGFQAAAGNLGLVDSFDVTGVASSPEANVALAEAFVAPTSYAVGGAVPGNPAQCTTPPDTPPGCVVFGQGAEMTSDNGLWGDSLSKGVTAFLPLSQLHGMPDGLVRIWVHAKDIAGNWGAFSSVDLVLDSTAPAVDSAVNTAPNASTRPVSTTQLPIATHVLAVQNTTGFPAAGRLAVQTFTGWQVISYTGISGNSFTGVTGGTGRILAASGTIRAFTGVAAVTAHDPALNGVASGIAAAEWFTGTDPGPGNGTRVTSPALPGPATSASVTFQVTGLQPATPVQVRVQDAAGNWSPVRTVTL